VRETDAGQREARVGVGDRARTGDRFPGKAEHRLLHGESAARISMW